MGSVTSADRAILHAAATGLAASLAGHPDQALMQRIASTDPLTWDEGMSVRAALAIDSHRDTLTSIGIDPFLVPVPPSNQRVLAAQTAPTPATFTDTATGQHTIDARSAFDQAEKALSAQAEAYDGEAKTAPFDYEHTIVGLQGVPLDDLGSVTQWNRAGFEAAGLTSAFDVLMHVPLRYIDRSTITPIRALPDKQDATVLGVVVGARKDRTAPKGKSKGIPLAKITVQDHTGTLHITHFSAAWQADRFKPGDEVIVQGRVTYFGDKPLVSMANPLMDRTGNDTARIVPVYPQLGTGKTKAQRAAAKASGKSVPTLTTWAIHRAVTEIINRMGDLSDPIPSAILTARGLMARQDAFVQVHTPATDAAEQPARDRLAYDELLRMQLALGMRRHVHMQRAAVTHQPTGQLTGQVLAKLPYRLTDAQARSLREIKADMIDAHPMSRMLQGDVGFGKSNVALFTLLMALEGGYQGALMAPTSILARQLYTEIHDYTDGLTHPDGRPVRVEFIPDRQKTRARRAVDEGLRDGSVDIIVGTHGLIEDDVTFHRLGLVVVDEQHRFGVEQRARLRDKGADGATPDMLAMTATPIPRTSAMTVFGDLAVSVLDQAPPGRIPVSTRWVSDEPNYDDPTNETWAAVREAVTQGRQAYVVCPLVEDSETKAAAAAEQVLAALGAGSLSGLRLGLVHGKQKPADRDEQMSAYKAGDVDVLVATTVIEVGVSVPNATHIVILEPKQFGIAQLHQLRGRVGRGQHAGYCTLYGKVTSDDGIARMRALCSTTDGFVLAAEDLRIRGSGQILGSAQAGLSDLKVASLDTDENLIVAAREDATQLLTNDPGLQRRPALRAEVIAALGSDGAEWLART